MNTRALRAEDLLLAAWNVVGIPLVAVSALAPVLAAGGEPSTPAGLLQLASVAGAIVAIATRPAGVPAPRPDADGGLRYALFGPLIAAVAFVAGSASDHLGTAVDGPLIGITFLVIVGAMAFGDRLPVIDAGVRRALIVPFIAICAGLFNGFAADLLEGMDVGQLVAALTVDETGFALFIIGMILAGLAFFYASLVVAPRVLVAPEEGGGWLIWPARFVLYVASAVLGIGWLTVITG